MNAVKTKPKIRLDSIGGFVSSYRLTHGLTMEELGLRLGYKATYAKVFIFQLENNKYRFPVQFIKRFRKILTKTEFEVLKSIAINALLEEIG